MDNITIARLIGLVIVIIIFAITVLLMPRIFGVNPASTPAEAPPQPEPAAPPAPTQTATPVARPAVTAQTAELLAKR